MTEQQKSDAVSLAIAENENNRPQIKNYNLDGNDQLAVVVSKLWAPGRKIHVKFLNGDGIQKKKCEREAHKWEEFANIEFIFDDSEDATIRISFYDGQKYTDQGSWSYIGTDALFVPQNEATMNYGWLYKNTTDAEWSRVVLHEFGHAIGCEHENQQPAQNIKWDKNKVYSYYMGPPNNWTKDDVDINILNPSSPVGMEYTEFDEESIMAYSIPPQFTTDGKGIRGGSTLSVKDKELVKRMYSLPNQVKQREIVPGKPAIYDVLTYNDGLHTYKMFAETDGEYRVWSSLLGGHLFIYDMDHNQITSGKQQFTTWLKAGEYQITVSAIPVINYRIVGRKIK